jgi:ubiquinone/menaquinone biosynthesis C-methylase UbiE
VSGSFTGNGFLERTIKSVSTFYDRRVLPWLINCAMRHEEATRLRRVNVPAARGVVLEVGIGSGLNLPFYTTAVERLYGVDPSAELLRMASANARSTPFPVELLNQDASSLPLTSESVDTVVVTWSLCSIGDPAGALRDMRRVLKPGGTLIFVEHGLSPDAGIRKWQNRLTPMWRRFAGGCHLNRKVDELVQNAGFALLDLRTGYVPGPRPFTFMYEGRARRAWEGRGQRAEG